ncbi:MAG: RDD family protein [Reinekea sp.]|nr:RDD family protein [Reinekea sp.]
MEEYKQAHSHRAIGSVIYDALVLLGLLMIAGFIAVGLHFWVTGSEVIPHNLIFQLYLLVIIIGYFLYFWRKSGQTVGMKAWRIKLVNQKSGAPTVKQLLVRLFIALPAYALLCVGVFWQYWSKDGLTWQDKVSQTKLIHIPKK